MEGYHESVLLREVSGFLDVKVGKWYLDCTLGDGGHALEVLKLGSKVIGLDVDPEAIKRAGQRFRKAGFTDKDFKIICGNFRDLQTATEGQSFSGVYFDLGVSSLQLESPDRGFSFRQKGPLDMRMDPNLQVTALDLIKALNKGELYEIFSKFGEEKYSRQLADVIVSSREITSTKDLADLVERYYQRRGIKVGKIHPATKIFQALRIVVNDELNVLKEALSQVLEILESNGKVVVISFHSLEDRIVKSYFRQWQDNGLGFNLIKKPIQPQAAEVLSNPRSRSARLRVFQKR